MVSVPRCASDWVGDCISDAHFHIYKMPVLWTYIDKEPTPDKTLPFIDDQLEMPKGWTGIYNIHPNLLIERGFDKVIVLTREKDTWIRVELLYYLKVMKYLKRDGKRHSKFKWVYDLSKEEVMRDLSAQWDSQYKNVTAHANLYQVSIEDLNDHMVDAFYELFDFLEFRRFYEPMFGRPIIMPQRPSFEIGRNWEKYSARLPRYQEYCENLDVIGDIYHETMNKLLDKELEEWI